jgi:hypothetical protein
MSTMAAALQALAFLGTVATVLAAGAATMLFAMLGRALWAKRAAVVGAGVVTAYAFALFAVGVVSPAIVLPPGERKAFCEIDCHVVYEITGGGQRVDTVTVTVRELFDPASISPRRGDGLLHPGSRQFALVDDDGRRWPPTSIRMLSSAPLFALLRPGQSHQAALTFAVPPDVPLRGLLVEDDSPVSPLLIGHERSPFHKKTVLSLPADVTGARGALALSARAHQE